MGMFEAAMALSGWGRDGFQEGFAATAACCWPALRTKKTPDDRGGVAQLGCTHKVGRAGPSAPGQMAVIGGIAVSSQGSGALGPARPTTKVNRLGLSNGEVRRATAFRVEDVWHGES